MKYAIVWGYKSQDNIFLTEDREQATEAYRALQTVASVTGLRAGYLMAEVQLGCRTYSYFAKRIYCKGEQVAVPTPDGNMLVLVRRMAIKTKAQLEAVCPLARYKEVIE